MEFDLSGQRFGRLTAIRKIGKANGHGALWLCSCDCGKDTETRAQYLRSGATTSCGCYRTELLAERMKKIGTEQIKHGKARRGSRDPLFYVWYGMHGRCKYPSHISYKNYGGKGIKVCDEWQEFEPFYEWAISHGYKKGLQLDRIDSEKDYSPDNCRFITQSENSKRRKGTHWITINGETHTIPEWAKIVGMTPTGIYYRLRHGWSEHDAVLGRT